MSANSPELEKISSALTNESASDPNNRGERMMRSSARRLPEAVIPHLGAHDWEKQAPANQGPANQAPANQGLDASMVVPDRDDHRNPIFEILVQNENDVTGLLAYALYKQNKRDWLIAFQANNSRSPDAAENASFILSERIPRRIATYRRLAEDMLSREENRPGLSKSGLFNGLMNSPANDTSAVPASMPPISKRSQVIRYILGMLVLVFAMAILFRVAGAWLFGTPGR